MEDRKSLVGHRPSAAAAAAGNPDQKALVDPRARAAAEAGATAAEAVDRARTRPDPINNLGMNRIEEML
jgi:hypothetical protein